MLDLLGERLILRDAGSGTREILERHLAARDLAVTYFGGIVEIEIIPTIKACVRGGAGITFLYRVAVEEELARGKAASVRDLLGERLILREAGSGTREILERHLAARDLAVTDFAGIVEIERIPAIKACVSGGAGITFLYRVAVEEELARGKLADFTPEDFAIGHDFCLIWQRGSQYAPRYRSLSDAWRALM